MLEYAELCASSNFSFLRAASHPHELIERAAALQYRALAITDYNSLAGIVRAHIAAKKLGFKFHPGCRLTLFPGSWPQLKELLQHTSYEKVRKFTVFVYPTCLNSYGNLSQLLTTGKLRAPKGECYLTTDDFRSNTGGFVVIIALPEDFYPKKTQISDKFLTFCKELKDTIPRSHLSIAIKRDFTFYSIAEERVAAELSERFSIPPVASNMPLFHIPERKALHDVLSCIRKGCTLDQAGCLLLQNAERHLKPPAVMAKLFSDHPEALKRTTELSDLLSDFSLENLHYEYPEPTNATGDKAINHLKALVWQKAVKRYPAGVPLKVRRLLKEELKLIEELDYEKYFLACYDITEFARQKNILYQGRGAAANSAVCYVLGITAVDPEKIDLLFARFISKERNEPPDIDIDFEHERREEVIRYIYNKYGREFTALVSEVITYRHRSALRDTAKAFGFSVDTTNRLTSLLHSWTGYQITSQQLEELGLNKDSLALKHVFEISNQLLGFPRHLSQHSSGFIISKYPLSRIVPIGKSAMPGRTIIEWDKNDIEELAILKIDILALGMLTCIRKALTAINTERTKKGKKPLSLYSIPPEDPKVYDMICAADTIGVFQIESRAQMSMLPRLKPRSFYDLVIEVAIVRPGPIQGKMVHPYLKRRNSSEKVSYPDKNVEQILGKTLGVPIFQEQAMKLAIILAGFSPGEAEKLRRAMAAWKRNSDAIAAFEKRIISGMLSKGYSAEFAKSCVNQIKGFSEYGFPESHAASFALLVYISAWIKCYYPAEFAMALLNSQPMGFYAPSQIIQDAKRHGVKVLPVDINYSFWDSSIENSTGSKALRLGFRMVSGINKKDIIRLIKIRALFKFFESITELSREFAELGYELPRDTLIRLARADAFRSMGLNARKALWKIKALPKTFLPLDSYWKNRPELFSPPLESSYSLMLKDYQSTGLSLRAHPLEFLRAKLKKRGILSKKELLLINPENSRAPFFTAGIVICRQKPPTAKGVMFITLEDETGSVNLIVAPDVFKRYQRIIMSTDMIIAGGMLQKNGPLVYLNVFELRELDLAALT